MQLRSFISRNALNLLVWPFLCLGLYVTSLHSFLLFHTVAESFSIVIALSLFVIAWNTRRLGANTYVLLIGIAFLFIGIVDFVHTVSYKGIGIFSGYDANLPTQLWIGARYMEALSFLGAAWLIDRKPRPDAVFAVYATATVLLLAAIFSGTMFPDCYVEGWGLTPFKVASEYIICGILIASLAVLWIRREKFDRQILGFVAVSIAFSIASEMAFTFYIDVYGRWNLIGHFLKIFAFYFIYRAIIVTGLENPYRLLFYDLKRQREELETIIDASPTMIFYKDQENRFIRVNRAFAETTGRPKNDVEGRTSWEIFPLQSRDFWEDDREVIDTGTPKQGMVKPLETPGGRKWVLMDKIPYLNDKGDIAGTVGFALDVTEQRQADYELATTRRFLEIANRHTDMRGMLDEFAAEMKKITGCEAIGIRIRDEQDQIPYQACLGFSTEFLAQENMLSLKTDQCMCINVMNGTTDPAMPFYTEGGSFYLNEARRVLAAIPEEKKGPTRDVCPRTGYESIALIPIRTEKGILGLVHLADRRKNMVPSDMVATLEKIAAVLGAGTQRALAEAALRTARDRAEWLARFPEENPHPVMRASADETVLYCNPSSIREPGWACAPGSPLPAPLRPLFRRAMTGGEIVQEDVEMEGRCYSVWITPFPDENYANLYGRDVTERMQMEKALKERSEQLEAANRELESFSYSISHDLRAPLRAIDGFSRMLLNSHGHLFDAEAGRRFQVIRDNARKMGRLIDDLLDFSRSGRQAISRTSLDMEELVAEVWQEQCLQNPELRMTLVNGSLPPAHGDRTLVRQVWVNLLSNAVKFSAGRYTITVEVGGRAEGAETVYYVKDHGIGFDMAYHDKLFGVFQRLHDDSAYEGTGVGLAIVRQIVTRHGGRVWGEGKENEGATFYFSLPF